VQVIAISQLSANHLCGSIQVVFQLVVGFKQGSLQSTSCCMCTSDSHCPPGGAGAPQALSMARHLPCSNPVLHDTTVLADSYWVTSPLFRKKNITSSSA
jgi:hypothetical protein